jgi:hypothetical protein
MTTVLKDPFRDLLEFLNQLDEAKIYFRLRHTRPDAISIDIDVPGERWEVEFVDYKDEVQIEVEVFRSNGVIDGAERVHELFAKHSA